MLFCEIEERRLILRYVFYNFICYLGAALTLCFFPVANTRSNDDENIQKIKGMIQKECNESKFVKQKVPLRWMKLLDLLKETEQCYVSMTEVLRIAGECDITSTREVQLFLRFMTNAGYLTWMEDEYLRYIIQKKQSTFEI